MLDNNNKTMTSGKRPPLRLKKIFCPPIHHRSSSKDHQEMAISPPIIGQQPIRSKNSFYSLVSPTRTTQPPLFMGGNECSVLNSVPPRVSSMPKKMPRRSTISAPRNEQQHQHRHQAPLRSTTEPPEPPKKSSSRPSRLPRPTNNPRATAPPSTAATSSGGGDRRHSFHIPPQPSINASVASVRTAPAAPASHHHSRLANLANNVSSSSSSSSSTTWSSASSSLTPATSTLAAKKRNRQSRAAAAATMPPPQPLLQKSRSTPLRRIKAYNVDYDHRSEMERKRKQKELEELIAGGRRGSTLKLSLTPRGL
ncbi:hypothetical protein BDB00DRAFT_188619 [Zychaea mexicana]|uniref:uncharacterized protein n=1 Tax=Zychaea mexicana TaxID=64656 RepID=UPI0022FE19F2|nr:uncharacterized protein BDB00DRAFT_188619 [Zychaea mexicana]KAI9477162.1 hypothetical protein BDB00DRAFT_188619 [Zychaea mexicana]